MSSKITIDGFNGTGKTTLASSLAKELGYTYISMGVIFRSLSYEMMKYGVKIEDIEKIQKIFKIMDLRLPNNQNKSVIINGNDVTNEIMDMKYAIFSSKISDNELLQSMVRDFIRQYANDKNVIIDGRDTGRLLFPDADLKLALIADIETRAKRRMKQESTEEKNLDEIIKQIKQIDDKLTKTNCIPPQDAITIDTSNLKPEQVLSKALSICKEKGISKEYKEKKEKDLKNHKRT